MALQLYQILRRLNLWPSKGQIVAVTKAYQDLFRLSLVDGKLCCMWRMADFKFDHSYCIGNLRAVGEEDGTDPNELLSRLTRRAIFIHSVISQYQGLRLADIPVGSNSIPPTACLITCTRRLRGRGPGRKQKRKQKKRQDVEAASSISVTSSATGSSKTSPTQARVPPNSEQQ